MGVDTPRFIEGQDRQQVTLLPECLDDYVAEDNPVRVVEVFVDVPLDVCAARDTKGLYAASGRGAVTQLPGMGLGFEPPEAPDVVASGGEDPSAPAAVLDLVWGR